MTATSRTAPGRLCCALMGLLWGCQAGAAGPLLDEIVVTATKSGKPVRALASNAAALDAAELADIGHVHINEALQRIPGAWISRGNGQEHLTAIRSPVLTGAGSCGAFLMAQDGIPLRATGFCNVNQLFEAATELAERIEVIRGPGSAIHGGNALHGVVNIIAPKPEAGLRRLRLETGPYGYDRARLALSSSRWRLDLDAVRDTGYQRDSGFAQQKLLLAQQSADGAVATRLACVNLNQETAGFILGDRAYESASLSRANPNPEAYRDASSCRLHASIRRSYAAGELRLRPYARTQDMAFLQHFLPGQPLEENGHDSIGLQAHLTGAGGNWVAGVELEATRGYLKETQASAISPEESAFLAAIIPQGKHYDYAVDAALGAAFADYQRQLAPGLLLTAGLRFETMQYRYDNRMLIGRTRDDGTPCARGGCRFTRPADRQDSFSEASPRLGLVYDLSPAHQLYAQATQGFRAPQATELYRLQSGQEVSRIAPVELQALEVGARGQALAAAYEVSLFVMRKDSFIYRESGSRQNVDNGETRHSGLEVAADWRLGAAWHASLAFTWARHEYANTPVLATVPVDGNAVDTAPETYGSATLVWTPAPAHRLELEWVHIGRYYTDPANLHRYPGHDLLHLRGVWRESARASIFYRITNLTNAAYAERADHAFGSHRYFVGRPRSVFIGVELQL